MLEEIPVRFSLVNSLLEELRAALTPGQVVDAVVTNFDKTWVDLTIKDVVVRMNKEDVSAAMIFDLTDPPIFEVGEQIKVYVVSTSGLLTLSIRVLETKAGQILGGESAKTAMWRNAEKVGSLIWAAQKKAMDVAADRIAQSFSGDDEKDESRTIKSAKPKAKKEVTDINLDDF